MRTFSWWCDILHIAHCISSEFFCVALRIDAKDKQYSMRKRNALASIILAECSVTAKNLSIQIAAPRTEFVAQANPTTKTQNFCMDIKILYHCNMCRYIK